MLEPVAIVYFSGTGNTEAVAEFVAEEMSGAFKVDLIKAEDITRRKIDFDVEKYQMIGFGYPIHGFNAPMVMYDLVKQLPDSGNKRVFLFSTCAGPLYCNDIASFNLKESLCRRDLASFTKGSSTCLQILQRNTMMKCQSSCVTLQRLRLKSCLGNWAKGWKRSGMTKWGLK